MHKYHQKWFTIILPLISLTSAFSCFAESPLSTLLDLSEFNGIIIVQKEGKTIYSARKGYANFESKIPLSFDDKFVIGSISKQITAVLVLREVEKGTINLQQTIDTYLPDLSQEWAKQVTVHHLLIHTHGIVDINKPLEFQLGSKFHYSQLGYDLLAQILEKVTDKSFHDLSQQMFKQYGLSHTFHPDDKNYKNLVKGYNQSKSELVFQTKSLRNFAAAGSFISNAYDLLKWNVLIHSGKLVNQESLKLMKTRYATRNHPIFGEIEYGYGLLFKKSQTDIQIGALGFASGFVSASYYYPKSNLNLVVLENVTRNLYDFPKTFKHHLYFMKLIETFTNYDNKQIKQ